MSLTSVFFFSSRTLPSSQKLPAQVSRCRPIVEWRTSDGESTWHWSCRGAQTERYSSSVSRYLTLLKSIFLLHVKKYTKPSAFVCLVSGRTHRSNQVTAPEYVFLISELAGEQRFASIVAKRLESLVRTSWTYSHDFLLICRKVINCHCFCCTGSSHSRRQESYRNSRSEQV